MHSLYPPHSKTTQQQQRFVLESALTASRPSSTSAAVKGFFSSLVNKAESSFGSGSGSEKTLMRGASQKAGSSPLSSPAKRVVEDIRKEIELQSEMSHLHL